jgi:hypothetical protein
VPATLSRLGKGAPFARASRTREARQATLMRSGRNNAPESAFRARERAPNDATERRQPFIFDVCRTTTRGA